MPKVTKSVTYHLHQEPERGKVFNCLICWGAQKKGPALTNSEKNQEVFNRFCAVLKINLSTFSSTWDFRVEPLPFCASCIKWIQQLIRLQEKLESIQKEIQNGIVEVRKKVRESDQKFVSTDLRIIGFRSQALGEQLQTPTFYTGNFIQPTSSSIPSQSVYYSPGTGSFEFQQSHGLQPNTLEHFANFVPNPNSAIHHNYHQNTHSSRPEDFGHVGLVEVQVGYDECNTYSTEDHSSNDILEDSNDQDYEPLSSSTSNRNTTSTKVSRISSTSSKATSKPKGSRMPKGGGSSKNMENINSRAYNSDRIPKSKDAAEYFSPLKTTNDGRMFYETVEITKNEKGYICGMCGWSKVKGHSTIALRKMKIHIKFHFDAYKCNICNRNFTSNDILNQHTKRIHIEEKVPCDICQKPIRGRGSSMKAHVWTHRNAEEKAEGQALGLEPAEMIYSRESEQQKKHQCHCGKSFSKPHRLSNHMKSHLDVNLRRDLKCDYPDCDKMFISKATLRLHINSAHKRDKIVRWYNCHPCQKKFLTKAGLQEHNARRHKPYEEKQFICTICNKRFGYQSHLTSHLKNHKPIEDFKAQCQVCSQRMLNKDTLTEHRRKYHPRPKPERITVDINQVRQELNDKDEENRKRYNNDGTLRSEHKRFGPIEIHKDKTLWFEGYQVSKLPGGGFSCVTCSSEFVKNADRAVKEHIRGAHLGKYTCSYCSKKFMNSQALNSHKHKIHYLIKVCCEVCGNPEIEQRKYRHHVWSHKSPEEMLQAMNAGEPIPAVIRNRKRSLVHYVEENVTYPCCDCTEKFPKLTSLDDHRNECHPTKLIMQYRRSELRKLDSAKSKKRPRKKANITKRTKATTTSESDSSSSSESEEEEKPKYVPTSTRNLRSRNKAKITQEKSKPAALPLNSKDVISDESVDYEMNTLDKGDGESDSDNSDYVCEPQYGEIDDSEIDVDLDLVKCEVVYGDSDDSDSEMEMDFEIHPDPDT